MKRLKIDKVLFLISLQLIICGLLNIDMGYHVKVSLFIALIIITIYLFFSRVHFIQSNESMVTKLSRALKGNLQTRLFTNNDRSLNNIVFSINELIAALEKGRSKQGNPKKLENNFYLISHMISGHHSLLLLDILML